MSINKNGIVRRVVLEALNEEVSCIGFGCASLGSRVSAADGKRALVEAFDRGITWFDTAPSYGDGNSEVILGDFISGRRNSLQVATKVGVLPLQQGIFAATVKPLVRKVAGLSPAFRKQLVRMRAQPLRASLSGEMVLTSLESSLKRLRTDHVELLALHDPSTEDIARDDVLSALDRALSSGKTRAIGVAGPVDIGLRTKAKLDRITVLQFENNPFCPNIRTRAAEFSLYPNVARVTFGVLGLSGALEKFMRLLAGSPSLAKTLKALGYQGAPHKMALSLLIDYALHDNHDGVVLISMFNPDHIAYNLSRLDVKPDEQVFALWNQLDGILKDGVT